MYIKMCGMMHAHDLAVCHQLGIDAVGLVVEYPEPVPWNLSLAEGKALITHVPPDVASVVVCSGTPDTLDALARDLSPDALQVHGDETLAQTAEIVARSKERGVKVYRALRVRPESGKASGEIADPVDAARALEETGVTGIVLDSKVPHRPGGTGIPVDVNVMRRVVDAVSIPVIAAGGLNSRNVGAVIAAVRPWGVDVLSGIESTPGTKDPDEMRAFADAVREASQDVVPLTSQGSSHQSGGRQE